MRGEREERSFGSGSEGTPARTLESGGHCFLQLLQETCHSLEEKTALKYELDV